MRVKVGKKINFTIAKKSVIYMAALQASKCLLNMSMFVCTQVGMSMALYNSIRCKNPGNSPYVMKNRLNIFKNNPICTKHNLEKMRRVQSMIEQCFKILFV